MPSSMIFVGLVVLWLCILVPAVARHRQEVARPSVAALSGRVLERPKRDGVGTGGQQEADDMDPETDRGEIEPELNAAADEYEESEAPPASRRDPDDLVGDGAEDDADEGYEPRTYRKGRGGFDPEAAALTARAKYAMRQRVVLFLLVAAVLTAIIAAVAVSWLWWVHGVVDLMLVSYLVYLRRQVRMEEAIRERRAARLAAGRRRPGDDDYPGDDYASELPDAGYVAALDYAADDYAAGDDYGSGNYDAGFGPTRADSQRGPCAAVDRDDPDDDALEDIGRGGSRDPERVTGTGEPLGLLEERGPTEGEPALPRLQPVPPPPLPAGTALVEAMDEVPTADRATLTGRSEYRRAAG